jgi:hypothetical protein
MAQATEAATFPRANQEKSQSAANEVEMPQSRVSNIAFLAR